MDPGVFCDFLDWFQESGLTSYKSNLDKGLLLRLVLQIVVWFFGVTLLTMGQSFIFCLFGRHTL